MSDFDIRFHCSINELSPSAWDALAVNAGPFLQHAFLASLEDSGSVGPGTGWVPQHVSVWRAEREQPCLVMPLYQKHHSWGEYVFDWAWADAWSRFGLSYYPKLLTAVPFTPSTGPRLLIGDHEELSAVVPALLQRIRDEMQAVGASSWHVLFPRTAQVAALQREGLLLRRGSQFHWFNRGYRDFDDFLSAFNSRRRKNVRKERRSVQQAGVRCHRFTGRQIDEALWDRFYTYYQQTYAERGQRGYLSRRFFSLLGQLMPESILLVMAEQHGEWVAGGLYLVDEKRLYGRYWGAEVDIPGLHFEVCYYQGIEFCIEQGLECFDAGAQGEHKLIRGFEPVRTDSLHWIEDKRFRDAIRQFCDEEEQYVDAYMTAATDALPYRKDSQDR
ncbi:MAG: GNAT family N-acetyltransferase [Pseudohongiellaceae bacterium]